jgi:hypothetical protein
MFVGIYTLVSFRIIYLMDLEQSTTFQGKNLLELGKMA